MQHACRGRPCVTISVCLARRARDSYAGAMDQAGVPAQIGPYAVVSLLARGGMGAVYLGRHPRLGYDVAIKVLLAGRAASDDQRRRFRREVAALAKLDHPGLAAIPAI